MATFAQVRAALVNTIENGVESEIYSYDYVPDVTNCPAIVAKPLSANFTESFSLDAKFEFQLFVLVSRRGDPSLGQSELDGFVSHCGPDSIRQVLFENPSLGLENVDAFAYAMDGYGGQFTSAQIPHVGAIVKIRVEVDQTEEKEPEES